MYCVCVCAYRINYVCRHTILYNTIDTGYYSAIQIHRYVCIEYHWILHTVMPSDKSQWLLLSADDKWRWYWACNYQYKPSSVKHMSPYESRTHRFLVCLHRKMMKNGPICHPKPCSCLQLQLPGCRQRESTMTSCHLHFRSEKFKSQQRGFPEMRDLQ